MNIAAYLRLSKEDGDKPESDSIVNQRKLIEQYVSDKPAQLEFYIDDDYTGTNFNRPAFQRMLRDIEAGLIGCVIVKDLSRFGRDYIDTGNYLERVFPSYSVRFIAINDHIDSARAQYDMLLPIKNIFNEQYSRDISRKVRSAFKTKQKSGEFIGAFASYGYQKSESDAHKLCIDPVAAPVVRRVFGMFESGVGKIRIAKTLNEQNIPCPSEYKRLMGLAYTNGQRLDGTAYWTYATIDRMLKNEMYIGNMVQSRYGRAQMHGKARKSDECIVVKNTHEPIITTEQWERVQRLLSARGRELDFTQNISVFAGFLKCADCGRAMSKTRTAAGEYYTCGSYRRYGVGVCTAHTISHDALEAVVLDDINCVIAQVADIAAIAESCKKPQVAAVDTDRIGVKLERVQRLRQSAYEDYKEGIISKQDFVRFRDDYERQEQQLRNQLAQTQQGGVQNLWVEQLIRLGKLTALDRQTVSELLEKVRVFEDGGIEITYRFGEQLGALLDK